MARGKGARTDYMLLGSMLVVGGCGRLDALRGIEMKLLAKAKGHLDFQSETYFEHMWAAWKIVYLLSTLALKCFVHSLLPFMYTKAVFGKSQLSKKNDQKKFRRRIGR